MDKPKLLDLFCGAGGATKGYQRAGFYVVGVDIKPQPHYCGDEFYQADALEFPLEGYDAYHASPPCQHYTMMQNITKNKTIHPDLIALTREKLLSAHQPYVIENVYKAPLKGYLMLCGTMFGLRIIRHRFFETNFDVPLFAPAVCNHGDVYDPWHGKSNAEEFRKAMGIDWMNDIGGGHKNGGSRSGTLSEAIPPAYTEYIGKYLMAVVKATSPPIPSDAGQVKTCLY